MPIFTSSPFLAFLFFRFRSFPLLFFSLLHQVLLIHTFLPLHIQSHNDNETTSTTSMSPTSFTTSMSTTSSVTDADMAIQSLYIILLFACLLGCLHVMLQTLSYLIQIMVAIIHFIASLKQVVAALRQAMSALKQVVYFVDRCLKYLFIAVLCAIFVFWYGHWQKVAPPPKVPVAWHARALEALFWYGHWQKVAPPPRMPVTWHARALEALAAIRKPW